MTLGPPARAWVGWVGFVHLAFAYFALSRPDLLSTGAYDWALDILPLTVWAAVSLLIATLVAGAALRSSANLAFLALGLALPTQAVFGLSILVLTFAVPPVVSAVLGTFQWWSMAVANGLFLWAAGRGLSSE